MGVFHASAIAILASYSADVSHGFSSRPAASRLASAPAASSSALPMERLDRRSFLGAGVLLLPTVASARVFLDPAMYGDQELRVSAVDSLREAVRRSLLQKPSLTPYYFELALLDSLSYDAQSGGGGPDGSVVKAILGSKDKSAHTESLKECAAVLVEAKKNLKKLSSITIGDAVALAGAESVNAVGGPLLPTQLGRTEAAPGAPLPASMPPLNLLTGEAGDGAVADAFRTAGLTEREMTALLGCLLSIDAIQRATPAGAVAARPKFREAGKLGRASEFKKLSDEDFEELGKDADDDGEESYTVSGDDGWYIADTFGTADSRFGKNLTKDKPTLSTYLKDLTKATAATTQYSWVGSFLLSKDLPTAQSWVAKYGAKPLVYEKDLKVAYNAVTQLGAEFTGGKYESLLKNRKRKSLNDDELGFLN